MPISFMLYMYPDFGYSILAIGVMDVGVNPTGSGAALRGAKPDELFTQAVRHHCSEIIPGFIYLILVLWNRSLICGPHFNNTVSLLALIACAVIISACKPRIVTGPEQTFTVDVRTEMGNNVIELVPKARLLSLVRQMA
jgi:hypothetical protein